MRVIWTQKAERNRDLVGDYILEHFGYKRMEQFIDEVDQVVRMLMNHHNIGPVESLLVGRAMTYRSVIAGRLSKVVYRIEGDTIHIVDFWDCRREPKALADEVK